MYFVSEECQEPEESVDKREDDKHDEKIEDGSTRVGSPVQDWIDEVVA